MTTIKTDAGWCSPETGESVSLVFVASRRKCEAFCNKIDICEEEYCAEVGTGVEPSATEREPEADS